MFDLMGNVQNKGTTGYRGKSLQETGGPEIEIRVWVRFVQNCRGVLTFIFIVIWMFATTIGAEEGGE